VISPARAIVCCLAVNQLRLSAADVARNLSLTPSAVSKLLVRERQGGLAKTMAKEIFSLK
jgi:predicted transcriptional regulator